MYVSFREKMSLQQDISDTEESIRQRNTEIQVGIAYYQDIVVFMRKNIE